MMENAQIVNGLYDWWIQMYITDLLKCVKSTAIGSYLMPSFKYIKVKASFSVVDFLRIALIRNLHHSKPSIHVQEIILCDNSHDCRISDKPPLLNKFLSRHMQIFVLIVLFSFSFSFHSQVKEFLSFSTNHPLNS